MESSNDSLYRGENISSKGLLNSSRVNLSCGLTGCLLNGCVCFIIIYHKSLQQPFNHLILNLAMSDFLVSLAVILNGIINYAALAALHHLFNITNIANIICKFIIFFAYSSFSSTCLTLLAISIERYQCMTKKRRHTIKLSTTRKAIILTWLLATSSNIIPTYYGQANPKDYNCTFLNITELWVAVLFFILSIITTVLPILLMLIIYIYIVIKVFNNIQVSDSNSSVIMKAQKKYLRHSVIVIVIISIFTCSTGLPLLLLYAIIAIGQHVDPSIRQLIFNKYYKWWAIATFLFLLAPIVNPLLYNFASRQFRKVVIKSLSFNCCCSCNHRCHKVIHVQSHGHQSVKTCYV